MQEQKVIEYARIEIILPHCASLQGKIAGVENAVLTLFFFYDHYKSKITSCQSTFTYKKTKGWIRFPQSSCSPVLIITDTRRLNP